MPCYHPLLAVKVGVREDTGKTCLRFLKGVEYKAERHTDDSIIPIPCGQCIGCRLERSRQWAVRCVLESSLYDSNCFITLTFNDVSLNKLNSLDPPGDSRFQLFLKRLRRKFCTPPKGLDGESRKIWMERHKIRFFHCGEYGELLQRPHHHACLFNFDFPDKVLWSVRDGVRLYRSEILESLWSDPITGERYGFCTIGDVTFESAAYVARYVTKKITGKKADGHYDGRVPEYVTMSRRPGIAKEWFDKYKDTDVYRRDIVVVRDGIECRPPKYFDKKFDEIDSDRYILLKEKRIERAKNNPDNRSERLAVREKVKLSKVKQLKRGFEGNIT